MKFKKIHIIINPASGQDEPILSYLNTAFRDSGIEWDVSITKQDNDATKFAHQWLGKVDVIGIYGGDGSIAEVAQVLRGKNTPLAIIPGGTANVMAKELGIPLNTSEAMGDFSFLPQISITDGLLDVILLNKADLMSVLKVAGTTLMKTESEVLKHWKCKEIEIEMNTPQKFILDDCEKEAKSLHIKVIPLALKVVVPLQRVS